MKRLLDVAVDVRLMKSGNGFIFEVTICDDNGNNITESFRMFSEFDEGDVANTDRIDVVIRKRQ